MASGSGSAARAGPASSNRQGTASLIDMVASPRKGPNKRTGRACDAARDDVRLQSGEIAEGLRRQRLPEVLGDLVEEAGGREPALVGADQEREVLGHVAFL